MTPDDHLAALAGSLERLMTIARQPGGLPARPVPACPDWTLGQLFGHLGSIERWAANIVQTGTYVEEPAPPATGAAAWFLDGTGPFLAAMGALDPEAPCWNFGPPPRKAGFWLRRQAHEHAIHLVDASLASGVDVPGFADGFMVDGVDEVLAMFAPRQLRLKRMPPPDGAVAFHVPGATGWTLGEGPVTASITAPVREMYLGLWGRWNLAGSAAVDGDADLARRVLHGPLTP
ncbi:MULTISPECIES: maleylpyruvate isomerase family mycothiol-dependent enzyme [unclassified Arthrobacter]|uniref:maleylpyruvate isomerase family mycothiol-dependent enzyme n=1 Tax=unclassified Arthrobacter TaxID=235627 RepID=UPI00159D7C8B|nr:MULTISPECIES: maleylpyruvate isomerase family mycothiol-dependent enzyme [unclassified Arthrobacter]MCQ9165189.1 maleylpyruvate isomerase family mycothiol-dependent enzyme [Arthrobacter sp. STN4]NVM98077.1 maleylpyruvate isomerase family mycothiol-dependent enzyme [Arthrobacter sp. SDTb3-6]